MPGFHVGPSTCRRSATRVIFGILFLCILRRHPCRILRRVHLAVSKPCGKPQCVPTLQNRSGVSNKTCLWYRRSRSAIEGRCSTPPLCKSGRTRRQVLPKSTMSVWRHVVEEAFVEENWRVSIVWQQESSPSVLPSCMCLFINFPCWICIGCTFS